jgi:hypothetical protein
MRAPSDVLSYPLFSWEGGAIYGDGYAWRYRFKNSQTGEVSGLSALPEELWNLGKRNSSTSEDWTGQDAYIQMEGTDVPGVDLLELFRNTTSQIDVFYKLDVFDNPGAGNYVEYKDSASDEDIFFNETDGLNTNPGYLEGRPWSCAKVFDHPTGRVMLYGLRRHGERKGVGTWVDGTYRIEGTTDNDPVLIGMKITAGGQGLEGVEHRITDVDMGGFTVFPKIDLKGGLGVEYVITDDRDGRTIYMSKPGKPWSYDLTEVLSVGHDQDDAVLHMESTNGQTLVFTRRHIYALMDDFTEAPHLTYRTVTLANEGTLGLRSTTYTPFGMVFANERGVRLLAGLVQPVGSASPVNDFLPREQYDQIDIATAKDTFLFYDGIEHLLHVSYVPRNQSSYTEELIYDADTAVWRGPWRRRAYSFGTVTEPGGEHINLLGDDAGNLQVDQIQALQVVNALTEVEARISEVLNFHTFNIDTNPDPNGTNTVIGAPVFVETQQGVFVLGWISGTENLGTANTLVLSEELSGIAVGMKIFIGHVNWEMKTAYFDAGEPVRPKEFQKFRTRFERTEEVEANFTVAASRDGLPFEVAEYSEVVKALPETVYADLRIQIRGRCFQLALSGLSDKTIPQITQMIADISVRRGD